MTPTTGPSHGSGGGDGRPGLLRRLLRIGAREAEKVQSFRRLAVQLDFDLSRLESGRCLMLTPVESARDAARAALELADTLAGELGKRVLLVDASLTEGALSSALGHLQKPGLVELLHREKVEPRYQETGRERISLLARGRAMPGRAIPLGAGDVRAMVDDARGRFDYVLIATDSVRMDSRCLVLPGVVDRVLLLAVEGRTLLDHLDASRRTLENCSQTRVGLVLTRPTRPWVRW